MSSTQEKLEKEYEEHFEKRMQPCEECGMPIFLEDMIVYSAMWETRYIENEDERQKEQRAYQKQCRIAIEKAIDSAKREAVADEYKRIIEKIDVFGDENGYMPNSNWRYFFNGRIKELEQSEEEE